ncbi:hypothetical protein WICPIJ_007016 [Wickerhamomyces pijperi]|uniref:Thioesterase domain-containing protein n=1 Tax=Wickerhamomyces pijperi TaxID=599730 RepID=A0A9P8TKE9_WICPI|nr:hypothetical protein WICPIJ_007016 [Wickerhamomyces pijperi]
MSIAFKITKVVLALFAISTYKSLPLAYYFRIYWVFFKRLYLFKIVSKYKHETKSIFEVSKYNTYNSPMECDFYLHKSNSCYSEELDIARSELMTSVLQKFFTEYQTESKQFPFVPVASLWTSFKKEIKPFEKYAIESRILGWDEKWIFVISKFVKVNGVVASTSITKYVLKDGRKTIKPREAIKFQGLWSEEVEQEAVKGLEFVKFFVSNEEIEGIDMQ